MKTRRERLSFGFPRFLRGEPWFHFEICIGDPQMRGYSRRGGIHFNIRLIILKICVLSLYNFPEGSMGFGILGFDVDYEEQ